MRKIQTAAMSQRSRTRGGASINPDEFRRSEEPSRRLWTPSAADVPSSRRRDPVPAPKVMAREDPKEREFKRDLNLFPKRSYEANVTTQLVEDGVFNSYPVQKRLIDQNAFVVGVLGKSDVGKSTLASALAGTNVEAIRTKERKKNRTNGIDVTITTVERMIILDSHALWDEAKVPEVYRKCPDFWNQFQSVKMMVYLMCICDTVLIIMDGFDPQVMSLLQKACRLKGDFIDKPVRKSNAKRVEGKENLDVEDQFMTQVLFVVNKFNPINGISYENLQDSFDEAIKDLIPIINFLPTCPLKPSYSIHDGYSQQKSTSANGTLPLHSSNNNENRPINLTGEKEFLRKAEGAFVMAMPDWRLDLTNLEILIALEQDSATSMEILCNSVLGLPRRKQSEFQWHRTASTLWSRISSVEFETVFRNQMAEEE